MNKYEKAIDTLIKSDFKFFVYKGQTEKMEAPRMFDLYHFEILTLQELVEKATPKKPTEKKPFGNATYYNCPNCNIGIGTSANYCRKCGQALDWSVEE